MKATITYSVRCSHAAFEHAMSLHMKEAKFHEIGWRDTDRVDEDSDSFSEFYWPKKRHPELTKDLFFKMAIAAMAFDGNRAEFYVQAEVWTDDKKSVVSILDSWLPDYGKHERPPDLYFRPQIFNDEMANRLKKIAQLATNGGDA